MQDDEVEALLKETTATVGGVKQNFRNMNTALDYDDEDMEGDSNNVCFF